ncbi:hypothetical protein Poli38472_004966 [Pythium oligandrum]|uniref:Uncharacterized protein n=1 Tax=Pythium oligandrum TaxID=41045 RepID=A0A8K1FHM1_PYTOL|nr:hypothetical protein Poli38472_004966 [Pythium oligandrum]|eukprot:TMW59897.1 hypothetical protein Poli38472_004966 [Pythium oligandrum]
MDAHEDAMLDSFLALLEQDIHNSNASDTSETVKTTKRSATTSGLKGQVGELRDVVANLEGQLKTLRAQCGPNDPGHHRLELLLGADAEMQSRKRQRATSASVWKDVATRQYQQQQELAVRNCRLQRAVQTNERVISDVEKLLRRGQRVMAGVAPTTEYHTFSPGSIRPGVAECLVRRGIRSFNQLQEAERTQQLRFAQTEFDHVIVSSVQKHQQTRTKSVVVTVEGSFFVPVGHHDVADEVWRHFGGHNQRIKSVVDPQTEHFTAEELVQSVQMTLELPQGGAQFTTVFFPHRYDLGERQVFMLHGENCRLATDDRRFQLVSTETDKWFVMSQLDDDVDGTQVSYNDVVTVTVEAKTSHTAMQQIVDFVVQCSHVDRRQLQQEIDNLIP